MDPGKDVPVVQDADGVVGHNTVNQGKYKGVGEAFELLHGHNASSGPRMHRPNRQTDSSGGREHELELSGDLDDEEFPEGSGIEETDEIAHNRDGEDGADIIARVSPFSHGACPVQGWNGRDEEAGNAAGARRSRLDDGVLLGTKGATDDGQMAAYPGQECKNTVAKDGSKHIRREGESGSET